MKPFTFLILLILLSCSSNSDQNKYKDDDPRSLLGKWEIVDKVINERLLINKKRKQRSNAEIEKMKSNYIVFEKGGKVKASSWEIVKGKDKILVSKGIYEVDKETKRVRIEIPVKFEYNFHGGSYFWKIRKNKLYLRPTNHSGWYKVYRRAE